MERGINLFLRNHAHEFKGKKEEIAKMVSMPNSEEEKSGQMAEVFVSHPF